jgi:hypothetical protein
MIKNISYFILATIMVLISACSSSSDSSTTSKPVVRDLNIIITKPLPPQVGTNQGFKIPVSLIYNKPLTVAPPDTANVSIVDKSDPILITCNPPSQAVKIGG